MKHPVYFFSDAFEKVGAFFKISDAKTFFGGKTCPPRHIQAICTGIFLTRTEKHKKLQCKAIYLFGGGYCTENKKKGNLREQPIV